MGILGKFVCLFLNHRKHHHPMYYGTCHYAITVCSTCGKEWASEVEANCCSQYIAAVKNKKARKERSQRELQRWRDREAAKAARIANEARRATVCPYCGGRVKDTDKSWCRYDKDCQKCGRGWRIDKKGTWHALFDAGNTKVSPKDVLKAQKYYR